MRASIGSTLFLASLCLLLLGAVNTSHFPPWTSFHSEAPAFLASALILGGCLVASPKIGAAVGVITALAAAAWLQFAFGLFPYAGDAWVVTAYLGTFAAAWLGGSTADSSAKRAQLLHALNLTLVAMGLLAAFQCLAQWAQVDDHWSDWVFLASTSTRAVGNFGQPNQTATLLLMAVAATAILMVQGKVRQASGWALLLVLGCAVVLTQSRTALLAAVVLVAAFTALTLPAPQLRPWRKDALLWLGFLFAASWLLQAAPMQGTKGPIGGAAMVSVGLRPVLWTQLLLASLQQPWFGYGWLQVSTAQQVGAMRFPGIEQTNYAHNLVLDLVVQLGIPLAVGVLAATAFWLLRRARRLDPREGAIVGVFFILLPLLVHSQLELPHAYAYFLVPAGLLLGVFDAATRREQDSIPLPRSVLAAAALAWLGLLGTLGREYALTEEDFRVNRFENRRLGETPKGYEPPKLLLLTQFGDMADAMRLRAGRAMSPEDLDTLERTSRRYTWAPLQFRTALALALNGRPREAEANLHVIADLFPKEIVDEGRDNWERMQREEYPELAAVRFPSSR